MGKNSGFSGFRRGGVGVELLNFVGMGVGLEVNWAKF